MAKQLNQLNVNLAFTADTNKAKQQIQALQKALQDVAKMPASAANLFDDSDIRKASEAAMELEQHLQKAVNVNTGKLDLSRFSTSLKASGKSLNDYANTLMSIGPTGQQAFLSLAQSIMMADTPVTRINNKLAELGTTLKNTARWQISSSILHGFMGAIQSAYGYAQDLNESLNDIRIVTRYNIEQMEEFAGKANKAAKALSATTTEYTNASLIYFQQGLSGSEVEERTAVTIKMANAAGVSAEIASDQLTAVWNNFYNGSKSLEYYADVMTALGAATASSTDEISEGLNKFAAVAETVGLSYEYAASALATVTATTRQSADIVGTAFKTLFARLQDLELGETLDDGTTLGKYSAALNTVGINIKDVNGDMKDMDQILDELGVKWQSLSKDTQVALAQTVAGTRQYTQLIALMDNWDYFQENLGVASGSSGTLQEQADIYAESWEAAQDRVRAAAENVYSALLDDEFFIDLLNGLEKAIEAVGGLVEGLGGLKGVVSVVGSIFLTTFANKMPDVLDNLRQNLMVITGQSKKLMQETQDELQNVLKTQSKTPGVTEEMQVQMQGISKVTEMKQNLMLVSKKLTNAEREEYEGKIRTVQLMYEEIAALAKKKKALEDELSLSVKKASREGHKKSSEMFQKFNEASDTLVQSGQKFTDLDNERNTLKNKQAQGKLSDADEARLKQIERLRNAELILYEKAEEKVKELNVEILKLGETYGFTEDEIDKIITANGQLDSTQIIEMRKKVQETVDQYKELATKRAVLEDLSVSVQSQAKQWTENAKAIKQSVTESKDQKKATVAAAKEIDIMKKHMASYVAKIQELAKQKGIELTTSKIEEMSDALEDPEKNIEDITKQFQDLADTINGDISKPLVQLDEELENTRDNLSAMQVSDDTINGIDELADGAAQAEVGMLNVKNTADEFGNEVPESTFKASVAITEFGSSIMAVSGMITSIKSSIDIFGDESATAFEKVGAAISILMAVTSAYNAVQALSNTLLQSKNVASAVDNFLTTTKIGATIAQTAANWGLNASMLPVLLITLAITAAIAALVAIVWLVVKAFEAWRASTPEAKLKAAEEEASRLGEELTKAKDAANELRESIESYDTAIEKIKTLKEGTEEWRKAIQEANDIARQMIDENEGLEGKYHFNAETGLIEFDRDVLKDLQNQADANVKMIEGQKIRADNAVLSAKNAVSIKEASKNENKSYTEMTHSVGKRNSLFKTDFEGVLNMADPASWTQAGTQMLSQAIQDKMQQSALDELTKAYAENGGNFAEAMDGLTNMQRRLIKSMDLTDSELSALCQEVKNNTDAAHENTKQLIHNNLSGDYDYDTSEYKDFIADIMATDLDAESDRLYKEKYKDGSGMTDKEAQRAYAEMMGWDPNLVKNKGGNKAIYYNEEGREVHISDEQVRRALAQAEAQNTITSQSEGYIRQANQLANIEKDITANLTGPSGNISMDNYDEYVKQVKEQAKEQGLNLSDDEIEKFIVQNGSNTRTASQMTLKKSLSSLGEFDDKNMTQFIENISKDLSDEELELAVDIAASAESIDDFARKFEQAATQAFIDSLQSSAQQAQSILNAGAETGKINSDDLIALGEDETFRAYLEEQGETLVSLTASTYAEKMTIISGYYNKLKALEADALETNKQNYQADLASYEAILQYKEAYDALQKNPEDENAQEIMDKLQSNSKDINFSAYMDMDVSDIHAKIDEIENNIEEIEAKKISLNIEWETTEAIETNLKSISGLSKAFENDMSKVGDSYQMTAAQMREWAQQYPDLFKQAKATSDGLMEIDAAVVENYINGQEAEAKATIEANIQMLEANKAKLQNDYNNLLAEKEMALSGVKLEEITAEQMMSIKQKLTQYYIDCGMDEVNANQAALKQMGIDQDTYNSFVGESMSGMITTADSAAEGTYRAFSNLWERVKSIFKNLKEAWQALWKGDFESFGKNIGESFTAAWKGVDPEDYIPKTITTPESLNLNTPLKYTATAEMSDLDNISALYDEELNTVTKQMDSINAEIEYNKALLTQNLSDFGNVDIGVDKQDEIESLDDMIERYKELNEALEENKDAMDDASKAADRLYGSARLKEMQKVNKELQKEIALLDKKKIEAENYLIKDKEVLKQTVEEANSLFGADLQLSFDADGSITNYTAIMNTLIAIYDAKVKEFGKERSDQERALLDALQARIDAFQNAIDQYDETRSTIREIDNQRQDAFNEWQDNKYEQLSYKLEIDLEINEAELRDLEYRINKLGDTAAEMAEAIGLIYSSTGGSQYDFYNEAMERYASQRTTLDTAYQSGQISQADYIEGLQEVSDGIYENLEALADLDKMMMEYYGNTLAAANEELDKFIERMSHSAGILEHYSSIMDLLGKSSDYKTMGVILEGQADVAENQAKSSKAIMEMMQGEAEDRYRAYQEALASGDKAAAELYLKQYEEALAAAQEAEDEYLSNAEQWAESLKAILENKLADLGKTLEEALTGGTSFEQLTTQMERAASLQEEYLTSTNQIYETTKMMRAAQQEIDKTTNTVAKNKIANFIAETKQLQNQSKLSQYELDVQQAKYDLLLAEIALQEAQNAKSTVRLQRDAEGNFGYVYTADSSAIADATQKYEDAQNALYNIGLEGANDYGQKYQQTMNEMYDSLTELQNQYLSGAFESESAYNLAVEEVKRYYYAKLEQYSSLYATATMTDSRVVAEAWFNDFSEMMTTSETWKLAVEEHVANVSIAFGEWQSQVEAIASDAGIGGDLESLKSKVNGIVLETSSLTTELTKQGGTIDSLQDSLDTVKQSTNAYAELREQLQLVAERYREVAQAASEAAAAEALIDRSNEQIKDFGEQANECIRKIESTYAEMEEKLKEVKEKYLRGEIDENQYNEQINAIKSQYYEELKKLSQEYREILAKDNDLVAEDWFLTLEEMLKTEETFNQSVEEYLKEVEEYFKNMGQTTQDVAVETGGILQKFTADVGGVKKAIDLLNQSIVGTGGLVDAFEEQDSYIDNSINSYESLCSSLSDTINMYRELAAAARSAARAQSSVSGGGGGSSYSGIDMNTPRSEFSYAHFDTGGYTGQWGSYGKLAMLHEKELILNKGDTENFLASMGILNNILQTIDLQSANAQIGGILTTPNFHGGGNDMLEQNVHIEASFPNVQNSNDIEEAFNNLINRASQYANRK